MTAQPTRDQLLDQLDQQEAIIRRQERYIEELENTDAVGLKARATRAEARADIRGRAVAIYQQRAREAEAERDGWRQTALDERGAALDALEQIKARDARIKAVQDALDGDA